MGSEIAGARAEYGQSRRSVRHEVGRERDEMRMLRTLFLAMRGNQEF